MQKNSKFYLLLLVNILTIMILFIPIRVFFYESIELDVGQISLIFMVYQVTKVFLEIPTGYIGDKVGRKKSTIIGLIIILISAIIMYLSSYVGQLISAFTLAMGLTFISGSFDALLYDSIDKKSQSTVLKRSNLISYVELSSYALSYVLSSYLVSLEMFNFIFFESILVIVLAVIVLAAIEDNQQQAIAEKSIKFNTAISGLVRNKKYISILLSIHTFTMIDIPFYAFTLLILNEKGLTVFQSGLAFAIILLINPISGTLLMKVNPPAKVKIFLLKYSSIFGVTFIVLSLYANSITMVILCMLISRSLYSLIAPYRYKIKQELIKEEYRAVSLSFDSIIMSCMASVTYIVIAFVPELAKALLIMAPIAILICFLNGKYLLGFVDSQFHD